MKFLEICFFLILFALGSQAAPLRFAVIGDYGTDDANELAVSQLVKTNLQPEFILTTGDNQYDGADAYDRNIGKYYGEYIGNYKGVYGPGSATNRFWPALGNHDYLDDDYAAYLDYFTLPGNERYYEVILGPVHFFLINTDSHEPDGIIANSTQGLWLSNKLADSVSPWKVVVMHHPPYSSADSNPGFQWPFKSWGAHVILAGHAHHYERLEIDDISYIVNGAGGAPLAGDVSPRSGSQLLYNSAHGAMLCLADDRLLELSFYSVADGGTLVDTLRLTNNALPRLTISRVNGTTNQITWSTNYAGFVAESAPSMPGTWTPIPAPPSIVGTNYVLRIRSQNASAYYRLRRAAGP